MGLLACLISGLYENQFLLSDMNSLYLLLKWRGYIAIVIFQMTEQAIALWKSQVPSYERIIVRCCHRILTPLTRFLPPDFE